MQHRTRELRVIVKGEVNGGLVIAQWPKPLTDGSIHPSAETPLSINLFRRDRRKAHTNVALQIPTQAVNLQPHIRR
ncbi:hypothetical protein D3C78_1568930 [compost metagenome]